MNKKTAPISLGFDPAIENREGWSRREFLRAATLAGTAGFLGLGPEAAAAQQPKKIPRIGFLTLNSVAAVATRLAAFQRGLRDLGYVEGKNIAIEYRYADGKLDQLAPLLAELIRLNVDIIVTHSTETVLAVKRANQTIPIVFASAGDPVATGIVDSLARPGGNLTGLSLLSPELGGKRLELLKEAVPKVSRVAVLFWNRQSPGTSLQLKEVEAAAAALRLRLQLVEVRGPEPKDLENAFAAITKARSGALIGLISSRFSNNRGRIAELAVKNRLPAMYGDQEFAVQGGLITYGPDSRDLFRRAATYVDKILKGRTPADLPVEQPMKFELVINLNAAKQIGLTVPPNLLVRADRVIR
jgi:putative ABC transport system substrate-binding protein